jgi:hypothetical protein
MQPSTHHSVHTTAAHAVPLPVFRLKRVMRFLLSLTLLSSSVLPMTAQAQSGLCAPPIQNPIACENSKTGNPTTEWDNISGSGDATIQGFSSDISVNKGGSIGFKISTPAAAYHIDIYRLGYYNNLGARRVATINPSASLPQTQPACLSDSTTGLTDCGNWAVSATWTVPSDAVSGLYIARPVRTDTNGASHIAFVVRDDASNSPIVFQTSDTTWQAYNSYGGNSLYTGNPAGRAYKVSYNRPNNDRGRTGGPAETWLFNSEYPMLRWLEANGYNMSYASSVDTDRRGAAALQTHRLFLSVGHDEYWSANQRANVEAARDAGVNLAFFSGNEIFWKTRWENSLDASHTTYRTLVSYKETHANGVIDPQDPPTWTGTWRDPRFSPPADGGRPENAVTGTWFMVNGVQYNAMTVPSVYSRMRFWRNTSVAALGVGQTATLSGGCSCILGYEWDETPDANHPNGLFRMSSTTANVGAKLQDYGSTYAAGSATHSLTLYKASSGALVFGAGTHQWSWGLDTHHDALVSTVEPAIQQATVNLFADMGQQPGTLQAGLVAASASTDTSPPTANITSPTAGASLQFNVPVTISGTATDVGGGAVGGVEVSTDNGVNWHLANGQETWSYTWTPRYGGSQTLLVRASDDSANLGNPGAGVAVTVVGDTAPPVISSVQATGLSATSATVTWSTDEASDSQIDYGPTTAYGTSTTLDTTRVLNHSQAVNGLTANTLYHYRVKSRDASNNLGTSGDFTFLSGIPSGATRVTFDDLANPDRGLNGQYAGIDWGTNQWFLSSPWLLFTTNSVSFASSSATSVPFNFVSPRRLMSVQVFNGGGGATTITLSCAGQTTKTQSVPANSLATVTTGWSGTCTTATVGSSNGWNSNFDNFVYDTGGPDTTPPVLSGIQATGITSSAATISWTTDELADTQVDYGTTTAYGTSTTLNTSLVTSHSQGLSGLTANTLYHYRVKSRDGSGNLATSGDFTFTTATNVPPIISQVQASGITSSGATITWTTDKAADTQIDYGLTAAYGSSTTLNTSLVTSHVQALNGLSASTLYHYRVKSRDGSGNLATSGDFTFTTSAPDLTPPVISAVTASGITNASATITWTTDKTSDTQVDYGLTTAYGSSTMLNTSLVTSHSQTLSGLSANTLYHYRVKSRDGSGNLATSGDITFTTTAAPPATVTFDDLTNINGVLNGVYPTGVIDWGTNVWYLSGPWSLFTTNSISFNSGAVTSAVFTWATPRRLISLQAFNGGSAASTITLSCAGQTTKTQIVPAGQVVTISTGWSGTCTTVTVGSSNGWDTNFDTLAYDGG